MVYNSVGNHHPSSIRHSPLPSIGITTFIHGTTLARLYLDACAAIASALAVESCWTSPCLPFYTFPRPQSAFLPPFPSIHGLYSFTHLPFGKLEIRLTTALGLQARALLERSAHSARSDGKVAVVAVKVRQVSLAVDNFATFSRTRNMTLT